MVRRKFHAIYHNWNINVLFNKRFLGLREMFVGCISCVSNMKRINERKIIKRMLWPKFNRITYLLSMKESKFIMNNSHSNGCRFFWQLVNSIIHWIHLNQRKRKSIVLPGQPNVDKREVIIERKTAQIFLLHL